MFIYHFFAKKMLEKFAALFGVEKKEQSTNNKNARKQFWRIFPGRNLLLGTPHTSGCSSRAWCSLREGSWAYMSRAFFYQLYVSKIYEFHDQCLFRYIGFFRFFLLIMSNFAMVIVLFLNTRSYAALWAADLDWIVWPGYSLGGYILEKNHENQPTTMKNYEKPTWNH